MISFSDIFPEIHGPGTWKYGIHMPLNQGKNHPPVAMSHPATASPIVNAAEAMTISVLYFVFWVSSFPSTTFLNESNSFLKLLVVMF